MPIFDEIQKFLGYGTGSEEEQARKYLDQATAAYDSIQDPNLQPVDFEEYNYAGDVDPRLVQAGADVSYNNIDPVLAQAISQGDSEFKNISTDPRLRDAQLNALMSLQDVANSGGMTPQDRADLARIQSQTAQADRGRRDAIKQNMAARGMGGSGMELLAQLQSNQAATDRAAQQGLDVAGMAKERALQALMGAGNLGGSIRGQDFGEQAQVAAAQDAINRFNTSNLNQMNQFNAGTMNQTNQFNAGNQLNTNMYNRDTRLQADQFNANNMNQAAYTNRDARQNISNANTDTRNKQQVYNTNDLAQQRFDNQIQKAGGKAGVAGAGTDYWNSQAQRKDDKYRDLVSGAIQGGAAAYIGGK